MTDRTIKDLASPPEYGDMAPEDFRAAAHAVVDVMADYLETIESRPVFPSIEPGSLRPLFPASAPEDPEALEAILDDYRRLVEPNATAWQHPGFMAYFATSASGAGILGEMLTATIGQNPMLWRTSPIGTELEQVVVDWLRQGLGLPDAFDGLITDTASISSLIALAAARQAAGVDAAQQGLTGRPDLPALRVYASQEAHSSIEKACMTLGLGRDSLVRIPTNDRFEMLPDALQAAITADRAAGRRPIAIVATVGTTSSTSVDPVVPIADIAASEALWLHVDAAYAGSVALLPEAREPFEGWERADSIVVNAHKWLFTPMDASLLFSRRMDVLRAAFSLVPGVPAHARSGHAGPRLQRVHPAARATVPGPQAVDPAPVVRARGLAPPHPSAPRDGDAVRCPRGRRSRLGASGADAVLDGVLPLAAGRLDRHR